MKDLTLKDVLYALEFGGETLAWRASIVSQVPSTWKLSSGRGVSPRVADEVMANPHVHSVAETMDSVVYGWRRKAAA